MAEVTRVHGGVGVEGVINGVSGGQVGQSLAFYLVTVKNVGAAAQDLRPEMAAGVNGGLGLAVEAILRACPAQVLAYSVTDDNSGTMSIICDGHAAPAAATLQTTLQGLGTSVGTNTMDVSGTTVSAGTTFTVA